MKIIVVQKDDGIFVAFDENGDKVCSDPFYEDCLIKAGLFGYEMNPIPLNSWPARRIRAKAYFK